MISYLIAILVTISLFFVLGYLLNLSLKRSVIKRERVEALEKEFDESLETLNNVFKAEKDFLESLISVKDPSLLAKYAKIHEQKIKSLDGYTEIIRDLLEML